MAMRQKVQEKSKQDGDKADNLFFNDDEDIDAQSYLLSKDRK